MSNSARRKVCVVLVDRANYGRLKPVMVALKEHPDVELQIIAAGTMILERFDTPVKVVRQDGFRVDGEIYVELEGSTPATMAKSVGFAVVEFASALQHLKPDVLLLIGDRYEALSAALAGAFMNICIAHIQGGEVSGSIDESTRHAISKYAHYHFPSTRRSADYLIRMGEAPHTILSVGCPGSDIARTLDLTLDPAVVNGIGSGAPVDLSKDYLLVVFHPTTTEYGGERRQMEQLLEALGRVKRPTVLLWPNIDAGSDHISKAIRIFRDTHRPNWLRSVVNLSPENYLKVLGGAACAVGNSSSFVRDASYFGTPVVLVGNRQEGREISENVLPAIPEAENIAAAIEGQLSHGRYGPSSLYGDGYVSERLADAVAKMPIYVQKRLHYIHDGSAA